MDLSNTKFVGHLYKDEICNVITANTDDKLIIAYHPDRPNGKPRKEWDDERNASLILDNKFLCNFIKYIISKIK